MTLVLRALRGTVSTFVIALAGLAFASGIHAFTRGASRLSDLQKFLTKKIDRRAQYSGRTR